MAVDREFEQLMEEIAAPAVCSHPPRRFVKGGYLYTETCALPPRRWRARKGSWECVQILCDTHAGELRNKGWDVRLSEVRV